ncbi:RNA pseudouridine synthase [Geotalea uraniireducens]|uniref:RNA pseudouridine synthase n=1 Tax=Geotalea uraniireducens TaxID=351604 RepID=A0ABN6VNM8_9BACT|nr:RluA family pseudouridine synthase [Geotalea uraniireducens]BDV41800.1 RNA pseudouridine synthase [Geotalea uraniireducens]
MLTYTITDTDHCRSLESLLRNLLPAAPSAYLKKLLRSEHIAVNGAPFPAEAPLHAGDRLTVKESSRTRALLAHEPPALDILFEDEWIIVVNKPAGLPVHRTAEAEEHNLVQVAEGHLRWRETPVKLRPVNRLDRGTSGATILAKSATSAGMFGRFVKEEGLGKLYLAVVEGEIPTEGTISEPLDGKEAETRFQLLRQGAAEAFVALYPITGRTHQLRKHLSLLGHPIRGDRRYGGTPLRDYPGHLLHAFRVTLRHPESGRELAIHAPLPAGFLPRLRQIGGNDYQELLASLAGLP